jgi:hypothetical protein
VHQPSSQRLWLHRSGWHPGYISLQDQRPWHPHQHLLFYLELQDPRPVSLQHQEDGPPRPRLRCRGIEVFIDSERFDKIVQFDGLRHPNLCVSLFTGCLGYSLQLDFIHGSARKQWLELEHCEAVIFRSFVIRFQTLILQVTRNLCS